MTNGFEVQRLREVYQNYSRQDLPNTRWSPENAGNEAILRERQNHVGKLLADTGFLPLSNKRLLDVGCGVGGVLASFQRWGARPENLFGVDLLSERVQAARERFPALAFEEANAEALPFADQAFDVVVVFTVFTSILDPIMRLNVSREVSRVLRPGGAVVWYDFRINNPFNPHVRGLSRRTLRRLFPSFGLCLRTVTVLPPLARILGRTTSALYPILSRLRFLHSHYVGLLVKSPNPRTP